MVDRKLAKRFYSKGKYKKRVTEFCEAIDNYSQNKFIDLLKSSEFKTIFEILIKGKWMKNLFKNINKFKENKEKFAEALNKLKENLSN